MAVIDVSSAVEITAEETSITVCAAWGALSHCFKFTPSTTAEYSIKSISELDTFCDLYDGDTKICSADDDVDEDFVFTETLTAGTTYYLNIYQYGEIPGLATLSITDGTPHIKNIHHQVRHLTKVILLMSL